MSVVRILVDGYSLLHAWPELAEGQARHSAVAREALVLQLQQYRDSSGTPVTVFFDGAGAPTKTPEAQPLHGVEIIYSKTGQTADDLIERTTHRILPYGEPLVVTDDFAERDTVINLGGSVMRCAEFIRAIGRSRDDLQHDIEEYNRRERARYKKPRP